MNDPLGTYLHDHLAGAGFAVDLLQTMKGRGKERPAGRLAELLLAKIEEDRDTLQQLADKIGSGTNVLKEFTAWASEKASRIKLDAASTNDFGEFEALEFLALGVTGKLSLWHALQVVAHSDARLGDIDFERLISRAASQYRDVEEQRLALASTALASPKS